MRCHAVVVLLLSPVLLLLACQKQEQEKDSLPVSAPTAITVETCPITIKDIIEGIDFVGTLTPRFQAEIKSEYTGIVEAVYVTEWQQVKKGDPLAKLDTREGDILLRKAQAAVEVIKASLAQASVEAQKAKREYARLSKLSEVGLVTQQNLDDVKTSKEASDAQIKAIQKQIAAAEEEVEHAKTRLGKSIISSPINGTVASRLANVGDLVGEVGSPKMMFLLVDNRQLELTCSVPSWELKNVQLGQAIDFWTDALPGKTFSGTLNFINPMVNEADRSIRIVAQVKNDPPVLKGGLFVKGFIKTGLRSNSMQIPKAALIDWDMDKEKATVFVVEGKRAKLREIQTGYAAADLVEVVHGLKPDETLILRGGFQLKDGDLIAVSQPDKKG
ncbi:MAG: efflux RND transporter periplasmic adaptor subunit [Desulfobacterales bacterium]|nr:efflux RND transporter periplasmic adaptor subunit [Desulfobacterales bacterium]